MPAVGYAVEAAVWSAFTLTYTVLMSLLFLSLRFTPKKKIVQAKFHMLSLGAVSVCVDYPRCFDLSSVYGFIGPVTAGFLHNIVTVLHLYVLIVFILSTAKTLYFQMQKPVPKLFNIALLGSTTFYALSVVVLNSVHLANLSRDTNVIMWGLKGLAFDVTLFLIIIINCVLFFRLRRRLMAFIATVNAQEARTQATHAQTGSNAGGHAAAIARQQTVRKGSSASFPQAVIPKNGRSGSTGDLKGKDEGGGGGGGGGSTLFTRTTVNRSSMTNTTNTQTGTPDSNTMSSKSLTPQVGGEKGERRGSESNSSNESGDKNDNATTSTPVIPLNGPPNAVRQVSRITVAPASSGTGPAPPASPMPVKLGSKLAIRPTPTRANLNVPGKDGDKNATPTPTPQQSSHEQRVAGLKRAVRTLTILCGSVIIIGMFCIGFDFPSSLPAVMSLEIDPIQLSGPDPNDYNIMQNAMPWVQQINLALICWYCWTPFMFLAKHRPSGLSFMEGLKHGVDGVHSNASKYEATSSNLRRQQTVRSDLARGGGTRTTIQKAAKKATVIQAFSTHARGASIGAGVALRNANANRVTPIKTTPVTPITTTTTTTVSSTTPATAGGLATTTSLGAATTNGAASTSAGPTASPPSARSQLKQAWGNSTLSVVTENGGAADAGRTTTTVPTSGTTTGGGAGSRSGSGRASARTLTVASAVPATSTGGGSNQSSRNRPPSGQSPSPPKTPAPVAEEDEEPQDVEEDQVVAL